MYFCSPSACAFSKCPAINLRNIPGQEACRLTPEGRTRVCVLKSCDRFTRCWLSVPSDRYSRSRHLCMACLRFSSISGGEATSPGRQMYALIWKSFLSWRGPLLLHNRGNWPPASTSGECLFSPGQRGAPVRPCHVCSCLPPPGSLALWGLSTGILTG